LRPASQSRFIAVHLDFKRRDGRAVFFCEHLSSRRGDARVDRLEQLVVEQGDVVPQRLMAEDLGILAPRGGRHAEHLPHEQMMVGQILHPIPVRVEAEPDDAQHEDLPEVHAGASGGLLAGEDFGFQQGENLGLERGVHPEPLQTGEDGREFVAAFERQANLFDGGDLQIGLGLKSVAHGGEQRRMLQAQTPESLQTFNHHDNIHTPAAAPNPMRAH
jgi:hypothetical protein